MKKFFIILIFSLILFDASDFTQAKSKRTVITLLFHSRLESELKVINSSIRRFNKSQNKTTVILRKIPEGNYNEYLKNTISTGDLPDIINFDGPNLSYYAWIGALIPLDKYISKSLKKDFLPSIIKQATYNKKMYGFSQIDSGLAIWANKKYLKKAKIRIPKSINEAWNKKEFEQILLKLKALKEIEYPLDLKMNYGIGEWFTYGFSPILQSFGGDLIDRKSYQKSEGVINGPASIEAMQMFQDWFKKGYANASQIGDNDFINQKCALSYVGYWEWSRYKKALGKNLVLVPMPKFGNKAVTGLGTWGFGISSKCRNPKSAWKFLEYLFTKSEINKFSAGTGGIPSRQSLARSKKDFKKGGALHIYVEQLNTIAVPRPETPAYQFISKVFATAVYNISKGANVKTELDNAAKLIDNELKGFR